MSRDILLETMACLRSRLGDLDGIVVERAVIGLFFSGVKLSTGHAGSAATPIKDIPEAVCCPSSAMAMPFPGKLKGRKAAALAEEAVDGTGVRRALGIATLNALAQAAAERAASPEAEMLRDMDAFDAARVEPGEKVVVVGAFAPFLRSLRRIGAEYLVLEKDPATLKPVEMPFFRPAEMAAEVVPRADVLLITGTTLINETLERLLGMASPTARIAVVGPTVTMLPDAFFRRGCGILGGVEITDPDAFLDVISEGGSGYHFFGKSARKIVLRRRKPP
jgi:uncharacterized protein (DUF4213/DUF364 family)